MPLLFSKYAVSLVLLMGPDWTAMSRPPTSNTTSAAESAIRVTLAAVMASPVLDREAQRERVRTPAMGWALFVRLLAAAGRAADRRAAGQAAAPDTGSGGHRGCRW